jgi:hypothetical protein
VQQSSNSNIVNGDFNNFSPRLGVAYDLTGKGATVIRAGASLLFAQLTTQVHEAQLGANPTGGIFFQPNGTSFQGPGTITGGTVQITNSGATGLDANWQSNTPIFGPILGANLKCGNGASGNPSPCTFNGANPNLVLPYVTEWNLSLEHAFTSSLSVTAAYVGNHGTKLFSIYDINEPIAGAGYSTASTVTATAVEEARPYYGTFPWIGAISMLGNAYESNYDSLQMTVSERDFHGLITTLGYTYAHALDNASSDSTNSPNTAENFRDTALQYSNGDNDIRQRVTLSVNYAIPGVKAPAQLLRGWQLTSVVLMSSRYPMNATDTTSNISGTSESDDSWTLIGNPGDFQAATRSPLPCYGVTGSTFAAASNCIKEVALANMPLPCVTAASNEPSNSTNPALAGTTGLTSLAKYGCYAEGTAAIVPPAPGTFGNMRRNVLRGAPFNDWDLSLIKSWKIKERLTAQFVFSSFNLLNKVEYATPTGSSAGINPLSPSNFGQSQGTPDVIQNSVVLGMGGPRRLQLGAKFIF